MLSGAFPLANQVSLIHYIFLKFVAVTHTALELKLGLRRRQSQRTGTVFHVYVLNMYLFMCLCTICLDHVPNGCGKLVYSNIQISFYRIWDRSAER